MNKVEQVARAIYEKRNGARCVAWGRLPKAHQEPYLTDARAAIEAMREPTDDMAQAGREIALYVLPSPALNVWSAMIDAALTQPEGE